MKRREQHEAVATRCLADPEFTGHESTHQSEEDIFAHKVCGDCQYHHRQTEKTVACIVSGLWLFWAYLYYFSHFDDPVAHWHGEIPKSLHLTWSGKLCNGTAVMASRYSYEVKRLRMLNPAYHMFCYDDQDGHTILKELGRDFLAYKYEHERRGMYKSDLSRLAILKKYGGVYSDADLWHLVPIDSIFNTAGFHGAFITVRSDPNTTHFPDKHLALIFQAFFACAPNHPFLDFVMDWYEHIYKNESHWCWKWSSHWLGPCVWKQALDTWVGDEIFLLTESACFPCSYGIYPDGGRCWQKQISSKRTKCDILGEYFNQLLVVLLLLAASFGWLAIRVCKRIGRCHSPQQHSSERVPTNCE